MDLRNLLASFAILGCAAACDQFGDRGDKVEEAKSSVGLLLADPSSAQFSDIAVKGDVVCGLVNAKNQFGAYSGLTGFIVENGSAQLGDDGPDFFGKFLKICDEPAKAKFMALDVARTRQRVDAITKALKE